MDRNRREFVKTAFVATAGIALADALPAASKPKYSRLNSTFMISVRTLPRTRSRLSMAPSGSPSRQHRAGSE